MDHKKDGLRVTGGDTIDTIDLSDAISINLAGIAPQQSDLFDYTNMNTSTNTLGGLSVGDITIGSPTYTTTIGTIGPGIYSSTGAGSPWTISSDWDTKPSSKISLTGEDADIDINGLSLMETLRGIQDRLNILRPNTELEAEWDELRAAGERYRELERQFKEKSKMWDTLKKMPPPEIT